MGTVSKEIEDYLKDYHRSEATAIKASELGTLFNVKGKPLRDEINLLRQEGSPICSSWFGYWYSTDPADVDKTIKQLESRVTHISRAINGLRMSAGGLKDESRIE